MSTQTSSQGQSFDPARVLSSLRESVGKVVEDGLTAVSGSQGLTVDIYETDSAVVVKTSPILGAQPELIGCGYFEFQ